MNNQRKYLLNSILIMIFYLLINIIYEVSTHKFMNNFIYNIVITILSIISILFITYLIKRENISLKKYKYILIPISIFYFYCNIISGIYMFLVIKSFSKRTKRELPTLEIKKYHNIFIYILLFITTNILFLSKSIDTLPEIIISYGVITIFTVIVFYKEYIDDFKVFKEYFYEYNSVILKTFISMLIVIGIINLSIRLSTGVTTSTNQENINEMFLKSPIILSLMSIFYAPIVEESLYRGVLKKLISNKYLFIIISGLLFGLVHVIDDYKSIGDFMYILTYASLGMFLAYTYDKTKNIWCNIYLHFLQNFISIILLILTIFIKK